MSFKEYLNEAKEKYLDRTPKVGEYVGFAAHGVPMGYTKVTKVTTTEIHTTEGKFKRKNGDQIGKNPTDVLTSQVHTKDELKKMKVSSTDIYGG